MKYLSFSTLHSRPASERKDIKPRFPWFQSCVLPTPSLGHFPRWDPWEQHVCMWKYIELSKWNKKLELQVLQALIIFEFILKPSEILACVNLWVSKPQKPLGITVWRGFRQILCPKHKLHCLMCKQKGKPLFLCIIDL